MRPEWPPEAAAWLAGVEVVDGPDGAGRAELLPVADGEVDAVVCAQAWHWVDEERAVPEVARVLRPGGVLGLAWHDGVDEGWVAELTALMRSGSAVISAGPAGPAGSRGLTVEPAGPRLPAPFGAVERRTVPWAQRSTPDHLVRLAAPHSGVAVHDDRDAVLGAVRALAERAAGPDGIVVVPHVAELFRSRRSRRPPRT